jgi:uncharacterized protein
MPLFIVRCLDKPDSLDLRLLTRERHLAYLAKDVVVKIAGPMLDQLGQPMGSLLIIEAADLAAAERAAANDPYAQAGLFAEVEVRPYRLAIGAFA